MPAKKQKPKSWSIFQSLHDEVSCLLEEDNLEYTFHQADPEDGHIKSYDTRIMGRFVCNNSRCKSHGWNSKKIAITIREYAGRKYNARVWHQRCRSCNKLGKLIVDEASYAERVSNRIKKWNGISIEIPYHSGKSSGPHDKGRCEGCRFGHCSGY